MSEHRYLCGECGKDVPLGFPYCTECGSQSLRPRPRLRLPGFWIALVLVSLLWIGTPIGLGIAASLGLLEADPESGYGWELGFVILAVFLYVIYLPAGLLAGLVLLFIKRAVGAGILVGTALGAVAGFLTCLAIVDP